MIVKTIDDVRGRMGVTLTDAILEAGLDQTWC